MKKIILIALLILSLFSLGCTKKPTPTKQPENTLYVYNWEDYISPQVVENFEKYYEEKYGKKIKVDHTYLFVKQSENFIICLKIL